VTRVVVDASAFVAVVFQEPGFRQITDRLDGAAVYAPTLLKFELTNVALTKARRDPARAAGIFMALAVALEDRPQVLWHDVNAADVALVAQATGLSAYDASYLWLAGTLGADLVTLDRKLAAALE
jgi:predicted nucleic acid-binding protein